MRKLRCVLSNASAGIRRRKILLGRPIGGHCGRYGQLMASSSAHAWAAVIVLFVSLIYFRLCTTRSPLRCQYITISSAHSAGAVVALTGALTPVRVFTLVTTTIRMRFDCRSTPVRLQLDRDTTIRRPKARFPRTTQRKATQEFYLLRCVALRVLHAQGNAKIRNSKVQRW